MQAGKDAAIAAKVGVEKELSLAKESIKSQASEVRKARDAAVAADLEVKTYHVLQMYTERVIKAVALGAFRTKKRKFRKV